MNQESRTIVLAASSARTTSSNETGYAILPRPAEGAVLKLQVTALTALNGASILVGVQSGLTDIDTTNDATIGLPTSGSVVWDDIARFALVTSSTATRYIRVVRTTSTGMETAVSSNALMAGHVKLGPIGNMFRVNWQIAGTPSPSATFSVIGTFDF